MSEPFRLVLVAAAIVLAFLLVYLLVNELASSLINNAAEWLDSRSHERAQRIERELARTKKRLALISQAQASLLDARAHEAAVALIMESYRASQETGNETS